MKTNERLYVTYARVTVAVLGLLAILMGWLFSLIVGNIKANIEEIEHLRERLTRVEVLVEEHEEHE